MTAIWPLVITIEAPLGIHICPAVGKGVLVIPPQATEEQFGDTADILEAVEWQITDDIVGEKQDGTQVVALGAEPTDVVTAEALSGADEQLLTLAGLL